ncbi:UNVERIFIED_ORG: putative membrane protein YphA (DoxX/SURF4 family) [Rhizobium etli]|uniref:DoxX family protein n=1 Tax=Rhizobium TaxID=379 RepID=UPI00098F4FE1|nr:MULTISPECIES: DoxX family protein [Rhizobium]ARQ61839.1 DoxX family protein [Rhizobium sp. Kim5]RSC02002.1 DoxX family protein [Rhizobium sophoriradicis]
MSNATTISPAPRAGRLLQIAIWSAQVLIFAAFTLFGCMKFFMPVDQLAAMWVWPGQVPAWFLRLMGIIDFAGGVGVLLPALTRIQPRLTVLAAIGCVLLQIAAMIFHLSRGEAPALPLNVILLGLSAFILWGRGRRAPVTPRG